MKLVSVAVAVVPISLYGCGGGFLDEDEVESHHADGVEKDRTLEETWPLQFQGKRCRGNLQAGFVPKTLSECQFEAQTAHALQYQFRESDGACALILREDGCASPEKSSRWNTYKNPNELWAVAAAGRKCTGKGKFVTGVQTILECQHRAVDAGVEFFSFKASNSHPSCQILQRCDFIRSSAWSTYVQPVSGHSDCSCAASTTTTTTSTFAPWTHVEIQDFKSWQKQWGVHFEGQEASLRQKIFEENTRAIVEHNQGSNSWWKVQNQFTHLLQSEFEELLTYDESQAVENSDVPVFEEKPDAPAYYDYYDYYYYYYYYHDVSQDNSDTPIFENSGDTPIFENSGDTPVFEGHGPGRRLTARHWSVSPVKDQGSCGSCWAFAAVAGMEAAARVHLSRSDILSEQQTMDCTSTNACGGGWAERAYPALVGSALYSASSYPYSMRNGVCHAGMDSGLRITSFIKSVPNSATDADMVAGLNGNPLVVTVDASSWGGYGGGIHSCPKATCSTNHQVLATGYDGSYFKLKNSWGSSWGEGGYIRIARTANGCGTDGTSAILRYGAFYPVMSTTSTTTTPAYFLADGGETCDEACDGAGQECDIDALEAAAVNIDTCVGILNGLGKPTASFRGTHQDDNAGCTWGPWDQGYAQLYRKGGLGPRCSERNQDRNRQRLCACKPKFFLAQGGESCTQACQAMPSGPKQCHLPSLIYAARDQNKCQSFIQHFGGRSTVHVGTYQDDNSGCSYHPDQGGWAQVYRKNDDDPKCDEVNQDPARQRLCACI